MCHLVRSLWVAAATAACLVAPIAAVADGGGLAGERIAERAGALPGPQGWSFLLGNMPAHTTLDLRAAVPGRPRTARLLGNYFVDGALPDHRLGGFRATGGVVLPALPANSLAALVDETSRRIAPDALQRWAGSSYVGLGYTLAWQSGLRLNADVGVTRPFGVGSLTGLGGGGDWLDDDALRNLRPSTSLELGMNYSF